MTILYVTSLGKGIGKTMVCAGIARQMQKDGKKVGYLKLVSADGNMAGDAVFMKSILGSQESAESMCLSIKGKDGNASKIKQACNQVAQAKDIVIAEGLPLEESGEIVKAIDATILIIEDYGNRLAIDGYKALGKSLVGVMINRVPVKELGRVSSEASAKLGMSGIEFMGVIPEDRMLCAITVAELAEKLQGKILNLPDRTAELVENVMVGAMAVDPGPEYFGRKANKAVVVRGERPDMQIAALQTSTRCLVIGGGAEPIPVVSNQAEVKKVPIISAKGNTVGIIEAIENAVSNARFGQEKKLPRLSEIMGKQFNYQALYKGMGWAK